MKITTIPIVLQYLTINGQQQLQKNYDLQKQLVCVKHQILLFVSENSDLFVREEKCFVHLIAKS